MANSTRRTFLRQCGQGLSALAASNALPANATAQHPNIVFIMADDLGYGDPGCYGSQDIQTPNIDALAQQGVRFTQYYANAAECTPTRAALLTGRYQQRLGGLECAIGFGNVGRYDDAIRLREHNQLGLPATEITISMLLKQAGYRTGVTGKWHLGYEEKFHPSHHGFDYSWGPLGGGVDYFHHVEPDGWHTLQKNGSEIHAKGYMTELITEEAVDFIRREQGNPFFLYAPYTAPHTPYQGPDDKAETHKTLDDFNKGDRYTYIKMVESLDRGVGEILRELKTRHLEENTLVIFASDNGGAKYADNGELNKGKGTLYEGGIRVPCVIRWPRRIAPGSVSDRVCLTLDLSASIINAAGIEPPSEKPFDGIDVISSLEKQDEVPRTLYFRNRRGARTWRAVRKEKWKYLSLQDGDQFEDYLFDLSADPGEKYDVRRDHSNIFDGLKKQLFSWENEMKQTMR